MSGRAFVCRVSGLVACLLVAGLPVIAQEVEPRRWSHLPVDLNIMGVGAAYTVGDIFFDPVLNVSDTTLELQTYVAKYIRSFELLSRSARIAVIGAYQDGRWEGVRDGEPLVVTRQGMADPSVRFAVNLYGAPPLRGKAFAERHATSDRETIVGAALLVTLPLGDYMEDKLINLGGNRFVVHSQFGAIHRRGPLSMELTMALWLWSDNDDFLDGSKLEQDPMVTGQTHVIYTVRPGLWAAVSGAYGYGGESSVNGVHKDDRNDRFLYAVTLGIPINRRTGIKLVYVGARTQNVLGYDTDTVSLAASYIW
jgi:hypothetical protein